MKLSIYVGSIFAWSTLRLVLHAGQIIDQNNLNGSFETGEISPWMGGTVINDGDFASDGMHFAEVSTISKRAELFQFFPSASTSNPSFSLVFQARNGTPGYSIISASLSARRMDSSFVNALVTESETPPLITEEWSSYRFEYTFAETWDSSQNMKIGIQFNGELSEAEGFVDNVILHQLPNSAPATTNVVFMTFGDGAVYTEPWSCEPGALRTYTIAAWIRPSSTTSHSDRVILERAVRVPGFTPGSWDIRWNVRLGLDSQGRPFVRHDADGSERLTASVSGPPVNSNQWTHLAAKYDSEFLSLYQNASLVGFMPTAIVPLNGWFYGNPPVQKPSAITIGAGNTTVLGSPPELTEYFCGELDEISIWDGPLPDEDIESLMYTKALGKESNLIGYWGFDDETARDISTNSIDGIVVNSTSAEQRIVFPATLNIDASAFAGNCVLRFRSIQDALYAVETNYSLINGSWTPMLTNVMGSGIDITVTNALGKGATFYRVLSLE